MLDEWPINYLNFHRATNFTLSYNISEVFSEMISLNDFNDILSGYKVNLINCITNRLC